LDIFEIFILALIQGLSEFLPISSSAHLILPSEILGWKDQGLAFDVAVHVGSLIAVMGYFWRDIVELIIAFWRSVRYGEQTNESRLCWYIVIGTIPAGLFGLLLGDLVELHLRSIAVIAVATIVFGVLLGWADKSGRECYGMDKFTWRSALLVGLAQAMALIPGTSRSGITMTAALAMGFDRTASARFSFLLAIPIILLGGAYKSLELIEMVAPPWSDIGLGILLSAMSAFMCIALFMRWIERIGMMPFVWYRMALGAVLIAILMG
jgi:undecaprenyl-diphosphatase